MKLQQFRYVCEIVDHELNLSNASDTLGRSQPGVSRYVKSLEDELGVKLFVRSGKRLSGLTKAGEAILTVARRMLADAETVAQIGREFSAKNEGDLVIATTHTHARYVLPSTIERFVKRYPKVRLSLRQGNPTETAGWVASGQADISIAAAPLSPIRNIVLMPCYQLKRVVLTRPGHKILQVPKVTLGEIARYPMITYDSHFTGREQVTQIFAHAGLSPRISISATDADVMKTYVKLGLGIAVVASVVYDEALDADLRIRDIGHLIPPNPIRVCINRDGYLRNFAYDFIEMFAPALNRETIDATIAASKPAEL